MTLKKYFERMKKLENEFKIKKFDLIKECVEENNSYKVGDIITDHIGSIEIEKVSCALPSGYELPCAKYYGIELKKNLEPKKKGAKRQVWQKNIL